MKKVIEWVQQCEFCGGTGVYVGIGERDGIGVVCKSCSGSGKQEMRVEYLPFTKRREDKKIKRVIETNPGIMCGEGKGMGKGAARYTLGYFGGMPYEDWLKGKKFECGMEMRNFTCPAWWFQSADYDKKPDWPECKDMWGRSFSDCKRFKRKEKCWEKLDEEAVE